MSINLGEVFTTFSTKYSKENILNYIALLFVLCVAVSFCDFNSPFGMLIFGLAYILISTIYIGYYAVTSYNEANNIKNAFPPISEIGNILKEGIKYSAGMFLISFIVYLIPIATIIFVLIGSLKNGIVSLTLPSSILTFIVAFIIMLLLGYFVILRLQIIYLTTLNFNDFFAFNKLPEFKKQKGNQFLIFFLFTILVNMAINAIVSSLSIVTVIAGTISKTINIEIYTKILSIFVTFSLYNLLIPNLNGQIAKYNIANEPKLEDYESYYDDDEDDDSDEYYNEDEDV